MRPNKKPYTMRLNVGLISLLEKDAESQNRTLTNLIEFILKEYLKSKKKNVDKIHESKFPRIKKSTNTESVEPMTPAENSDQNTKDIPIDVTIEKPFGD